MKITLDLEAEDYVPHSLKESIELVESMIKYYQDALDDWENSFQGASKQYYIDCLKETKKDLKALKRVHNYYTPREEHIS